MVPATRRRNKICRTRESTLIKGVVSTAALQVKLYDAPDILNSRIPRAIEAEARFRDAAWIREEYSFLSVTRKTQATTNDL